jgi:hypothetical protein
MKRIKVLITLTVLFLLSVAFYNPVNSQTVTYPSASGIVWRGGSTYSIQWSGYTLATDIRIQLYKGSSLYYTISSSTSNDGVHSWTVPTSLPTGTDYYVYVRGYLLGSEIYSDVSNYYFTISNANVTYPSASNISWRPGSSYTISWTGFIGSYVKIELFKGSSLYYTFTSSTANDGSEVVTVPSTAAIGADYYIRITSTSNTAIYDNSDNYFAIGLPQVTSPTASNISWRPGYSYYINWTGFAATNVKIELYKSSTGVYTTITSSTANTGSYYWTVPSSITQASDYWIRITSTTNTGMYDWSDNPFAIATPKVTTPDLANICWRPGSSYYINWTGFAATNVKIELYKSSTGVYTTITSSTANTGSYYWTLPSSITQASDYWIRVTSTTNTGMYDWSDNPFAIGTPQITYPTASNILWRPGSSYTVTWTGFPASTVKIELMRTGYSPVVLVASTANDGSEVITVPASTVFDVYYYIAITSTTNTGVYDLSDYYFAIAAPQVTFPTATCVMLRPGNTYNINWTGYIGTYVKIDLYKGSTLHTAIAASTPNDGSESWTVPASLPIGDDYKIRVTSTYNIGITDDSDNAFNVALPFVTNLNASGIVLKAGNNYTVTWSGFAGSVVNIELYKLSTSVFTPLALSTPNDGTQTVNIPVSVTPANDYRVIVSSAVCSNMYDYNDYYFTIDPPCILDLSATSLSFTSAAGVKAVSVTSNSSWTVTDNAAWLSVTPASGTGNGTLIVNVEANSGSTRTGTITVSGCSTTKTIIVTQAGSETTVDLGNTTVYSSVSTGLSRKAMPVTFSESGSITSISIYHDGGAGNVLLGVYTDLSGLPSSRLGVTPSTVVNSSGGWQTVTLSSPVSVTSGQTVWLAWVFQNGIGTRYTTGTPGRALSTATWSSGMPEAFGTSSTAGTKYSIYCTYTKGTSVDLTISPTSVSLDYSSGASGTFNITSNTSWNITDDAAWLNVSPVSGTNNGTVTVTANSENTGTSPRTAIVTIAGTGVSSKTVTVSQAGSEATVDLGNTTVYSTVSTGLSRKAMPVTFSESGSITSISIYHDGGAGNVLLGVYTDLSGLPSSRLGVTPSTVVNSSGGWQTVTLSSPVSVTSGQTVWLAWVFQNGIGTRYTTGTPGRALSTATWSSGMPEAFGTSSTAGTKYSIYCTYTKGTSVDLTISPTSVSLDYSSGASGTFNITSNTSWNITDDAAWLNVSPVSGTNNGTVTVTANSENTGTSPRTAIVTIAGTGVSSKTVTVSQAGSEATVDLGNTTVYSTVSTGLSRKAMPVTFSESGSITSISIYHDGGAGNVLLGVYTDLSGLPSSRLGVTPSTVVNSSGGWQTVTLSSPVSVTSGQTVWLAWVFQNGIGTRYTTGTPGRALSTATWSSGMPETFGTSSTAGTKYSIYCTYIPGEPLTTVDLGNTTVYSTVSTGLSRKAMPVTFSESGSITSISIYHDGGAGNVLLGVYTDLSGLPSSRLGVTPSTVVNSTGGWQKVTLSSPVAVTSGQTVWLAWVFQNGIGTRYTTGTPGRALSTATWSSGLPETFGTSSTAGTKYSIYCTYTTPQNQLKLPLQLLLMLNLPILKFIRIHSAIN